MKNSLKTILEIILFLPRWILGLIMMFMPVAPIYWLAGEVFSVNMSGYGPDSNNFQVFLFGVIGVSIVYYTMQHTRWGEWTKKIFPLSNDLRDD